ncbi:hypothetical protein DPMN_124463 [Dreissena polymorpha]|uniref:Uncharacterized protein n=1 Tax=Dreissena polymorpha TaxID=45954 RepID=A0A9D4GVM3_DREPO|nr:hypothetical protein DPMN_124463 [Dreissena polymorpha]
MWIVGAVIVVLAISVPSHAQTPSRCVQMFDQGFRKCFRDLGGFELDIVFSLVTNETSGRLPPNLAPQKANLIQMLCANRQQVGQCIAPLVTAPDASCKQTDIGMMDGTINSMVSGIANLCGAPNEGSACMKNFDTGFRKCLSQQQINPDNFFMLLADQPLPAGVNKEQLKTLSCSDTTRRNMLKCSTDNLSGIQADCKPQETIMVGTTLQNMMGAYEGVCTGKPINPDQCMSAFEEGMNQCAKKTLDMDMKLIIMVLQGQTLPAGQNKDTLKKNICSKWKPLETCGKDVILNAGCARKQLLGVEAQFARMVISVATACGDTTLPGACLLTLQKQFGTCFGKVGLSPDIYLSNDTEHKGALIGANTKEAEFYCSKKHDLFTCMNEVVQTCPGAEQTLSLTGFDLHGMERAVGILCHNIPDYLAGLDCFAKPTDAAKQCMEDMTMAITDLSTKQITQALNMDTFFAGLLHGTCQSRGLRRSRLALVQKVRGLAEERVRVSADPVPLLQLTQGQHRHHLSQHRSRYSRNGRGENSGVRAQHSRKHGLLL